MNTTITGVNLGGWLVLERWITPSLFEGMSAKDEYTFCKEKGSQAAEILNLHRKTFITSQDLEWLKENGIKALRVPIPHWIFGGFESYEAGLNYVDWIMDEARRLKLQIVLELHTAPGSQNGNDHSGKTGQVGWPKSPILIKATLEVIEAIAARYSESKQLVGIGLLNEPSSTIDPYLLQIYYQEAYKRVRKYCREDIAVIINDQFNPMAWRDVMTDPDYKNVWLDTHLYQAFDTPASFSDVEQKVQTEWNDLIKDIQKVRPLMIGEWSLGLAEAIFSDRSEKEELLSKFYEVQREVFSNTECNFFWTYKTEDMKGWSFRDLVEQNIISIADTIHR